MALFAISYDSVEVLARFARDHGIKYPLLSDADSAVIKRFGILNTLVKPEEVEYYGIPYPGSYLVDPEGRIAHKFFNRAYQVRETAATVLRSGFHLPVDPTIFSRGSAGSDGVRITVDLLATELRPRQHADLLVTVSMEPGVHIYGPHVPEGYSPTQIMVTGSEGLAFGPVRFPPTKQLRIAGLEEEFEVWDGEVELTIPATSTIREEGEAGIDVAVTYQACTEEECFVPRSETVHLTVATAPNVRARQDG